jgi:hypothetical protein
VKFVGSFTFPRSESSALRKAFKKLSKLKYINPANYALDYAIKIIESYQLDIRNSKNIIGFDLERKGFCQGEIYKEALEKIERLKRGAT